MGLFAAGLLGIINKDSRLWRSTPPILSKFAVMEPEAIKQRITAYESRAGHSLRVRAAFFDMDGVLYDSMPAHERSWLQAAHESGLDMTPEDVYLFEGQTGAKTINILVERKHGRSATTSEIERIYALKTKLFVRYNQGQTIPHVADVLSATWRLKRLVVTGSSQPSLLDRIEQKFPSTFTRESMITGRDVRHGKPHPEPYLMALERACVQPHEAIVVENAPRGVRSAHEAGCFTIAVNTGPLADEVLWGEGADLVLPDMLALCRALPILPLCAEPVTMP